MVEKIGAAFVMNRQAFMVGFEQIEAGEVYVDGQRLILAVRWNTMSVRGDPLRIVPVSEFPQKVLSHFSPESYYPLSDEIHQQLVGTF